MLLYMFVCIGHIDAQNYRKVLDLNGSWKFSIGDEDGWELPEFNDDNWEWINVPSAWENEGFHGYDGYAWYRTNFKKPTTKNGQNLYLKLGNIDDVDEVFVNGKLIGRSGNFPPNFSTAYNSNRLYNVPTRYLKEYNTIAVRVYDDTREGGIVSGDISLLVDKDAIPVDIDLQGIWKFKTGQYAYEDLEFAKSWDDIIVPGDWENQGYKNYDGYACYALAFVPNTDLITERMILVLGKIDDLDQVFVNEQLIGETGEFDPSLIYGFTEFHNKTRAYYLPPNLIKKNQRNSIVVRVYDGRERGGIYAGSIGLISQKNYIKYWNNRRKR